MSKEEGYWEGLLKHGRKMEANENLKLVEATLNLARKHGLEAEVMWSALIMAAEANEHGQTMDEVLGAALSEWDI